MNRAMRDPWSVVQCGDEQRLAVAVVLVQVCKWMSLLGSLSLTLGV